MVSSAFVLLDMQDCELVQCLCAAGHAGLRVGTV
jgi:hypothetical protein